MTTADTRQSLLQNILENPADDLVRLAFADWLEEHGEEEYGEFIRVQIELAQIGPEPECTDFREFSDPEGFMCCDPDCPYERMVVLQNREWKLHEGHLCWSDSIAIALEKDGFTRRDGNSFGWGGTHWEFRRGFIEFLQCSSADWFAHHAEILASHPLREVRLTAWPTPVNPEHVFSNLALRGISSSIIGGWPRITFHLPENPINSYVTYQDMEAILDQHANEQWTIDRINEKIRSTADTLLTVEGK